MSEIDQIYKVVKFVYVEKYADFADLISYIYENK